MDVNARPLGPSPAWLGLFASVSFAALVATSFASGYHLVRRRPPSAGPVDGATSGSSAGGLQGDAAAAERARRPARQK